MTSEEKFCIFYDGTYEPYFVASNLTREQLVEWFKTNTYYPIDELDIYRSDGCPDVYEIHREAYE